MKISIIVPVYNIEKYIRKCIESLLKQTYSDIEIIIVDDGSKDSSGLICDEFIQKDGRIKVIHKINGGVVSARKAALAYVTGDYICNVDGDDWVDEDYITKYVNKINENQSSLVWNVAFTKEFDNKSEVQRPTGINEDTINDTIAIEWATNMLYGKCGFQNEIDYSNCFVCVKKELYIQNQIKVSENIRRGEDLIFALYLLDSTNSIDFIFNEGYHYVQRCDSTSNNTRGYSVNEYTHLKDAFRELLSRVNKNKGGMTAICYGYCTITYLNYFFGSHNEEDYLYPFSKVKRGSKIVVYGAGNIGKNIVRHLIGNENYILNGWINTTIPTRNEFEIDIKAVDDIDCLDYDFIIIATNRRIYVNQMKESLKALGVEEGKVVSIFDKDIELEEII